MPVTRHQEYNKKTARLLETGDAKVKIVDSSASAMGVTDNKLFVDTHNSEDLLTDILKELKMLNLYMTVMTDNCFTKQDVE